MSKAPPRWTAKQLAADAAKSAEAFRKERLAPRNVEQQFQQARERFADLFRELGELAPEISDTALASAFNLNLEEALRYLSGPPISKDDLKVLAEARTLAQAFSAESTELRKVFAVIEKTIDPFRFPWVIERRAPTKNEKSAALLASSVLLASQRVSTARRGSGKSNQEAQVKNFLGSLIKTGSEHGHFHHCRGAEKRRVLRRIKARQSKS